MKFSFPRINRLMLFCFLSVFGLQALHTPGHLERVEFWGKLRVPIKNMTVEQKERLRQELITLANGLIVEQAIENVAPYAQRVQPIVTKKQKKQLMDDINALSLTVESQRIEQVTLKRKLQGMADAIEISGGEGSLLTPDPVPLADAYLNTIMHNALMGKPENATEYEMLYTAQLPLPRTSTLENTDPLLLLAKSVNRTGQIKNLKIALENENVDPNMLFIEARVFNKETNKLVRVVPIVTGAKGILKTQDSKQGNLTIEKMIKQGLQPEVQRKLFVDAINYQFNPKTAKRFLMVTGSCPSYILNRKSSGTFSLKEKAYLAFAKSSAQYEHVMSKKQYNQTYEMLSPLAKGIIDRLVNDWNNSLDDLLSASENAQDTFALYLRGLKITPEEKNKILECEIKNLKSGLKKG